LLENFGLDAISAHFGNGLLCLEIRKLAESKKQFIRIKTK
jgi:hypothetical protein